MSVGKLIRYGLPFSNVVATGTATNQLTPGRTLETLQLKLGGTFTKAMITGFKLKANGKTLIETNGTDLDKLNAYRGEASNAAFLNVPFSDWSMRDDLDIQVGAFDTSIGIANITTEVTIAGATAPVLTPILVESAQQNTQQGGKAPISGLVTKVLKYPYAMATGGTLPMTVPFGPQNGAIIKRLHVFHGGQMTGAIVKQDGLTVHESVTAENNYMLQRHGKVPQTNVYTIDFCADGFVKKALDTRDARSLEWLFTFGAADTGTVYVEYLDTLGNL